LFYLETTSKIKDEQPPLQEGESYFFTSLKVEVTTVNNEENEEQRQCGP
jgi:hypothetical protein